MVLCLPPTTCRTTRIRNVLHHPYTNSILLLSPLACNRLRSPIHDLTSNHLPLSLPRRYISHLLFRPVFQLRLLCPRHHPQHSPLRLQRFSQHLRRHTRERLLRLQLRLQLQPRLRLPQKLKRDQLRARSNILYHGFLDRNFHSLAEQPRREGGDL